MRTQFGLIAQAMMGPRASGRTHRIIANATHGATLLARDIQHADWLRKTARDQARDDLQVLVPARSSLAGRRGEFVPDHFTVESWLMEAEAEIQKKIEEGQSLLRRAEAAETELERMRQHTKDPTA